MDFHILGPLEVIDEGRVVALAGGRQSALMAVLLLRPNEVHSSEGLVESLWGEDPPPTASKMLQKYVSQLRVAMGGVGEADDRRLGTRGHGYFIKVEPDELDSDRFERLLAEGRRARAAGSAQAGAILVRALGEWRGSALQDFADEPFARADIARLEELRISALEDRLDADLEQGRHAEVVAELENLVHAHPFRERLRALLMVALYRSNRQAEALQVYRETHRLLGDELGLEPSVELQRLERAILLQDPSLAWAEPTGSATGEPPAPGDRPYRGLEYFDVADAEWFFGREDLTRHLVDRVASTRLLAVIGASGSGKSSLVRAGLLATVRDHGPDRSGLVITPTAHPLESLALALTAGESSLRPTAALVDDLAQEPRTLHLHLQRLASDQHRPRDWSMVVVIDQFEELFTLCQDEADRAAFVGNLMTAVSSGGPLHLVIALRADFYAQVAAYDGLRAAIAGNQEYIGPMDQAELRRAIVGPAEHGQWVLGPGLVDLILKDLGDAPGALPLLSHALLETWHRRTGRTLTVAGYRETGGVRRAIACTADRVFAQQFDASERAVGRQMLLRLTVLGDGTADTRRRVALRELIPSGPPEATVTAERVLRRLADARLVSVGELTTEITHEALIQEWPTLHEWLAEDREGLHLHREITEDADQWETLERDDGALYRGLRLARASEWARGHIEALNEREREFLAASEALAHREDSEREERHRRELETAEQLTDAERKRAAVETASARRLRRRAIVLSGALALSGVLALAALSFGRQAESSFANAESERLGAEATVSLSRGESAELAGLLAINGMQAQYTPQADAALQRTSRYAFSDRILSLPPAVDGVQAPPGRVETAVISPDGRYLLAGANGTAYLLDLSSNGALVHVLPGSGTGGSVHDAQFSMDGAVAATVDTDPGGSIHLWDVQTGAERWSVAIPDYTMISFSGDGRFLAAVVDSKVTVLDVGDGHVVSQLDIPGAYEVVLAPTGLTAYVASGEGDGLWDLASGEHIRDLVGSGADIKDAAFSPDGTLLATTPQDKTIQIWDVASGELARTLTGHTEIVFTPAFSPDGTRLLSGSLDGSVRLWDVATGGLLQTFIGHTGSVYSSTFTPDGRFGVSGGKDGTVRFWDVQAPVERETLAGPTKWIFNLVYSPDGKRLFVGDADGTAQIWDVAAQRVSHLLAQDRYIDASAFSPDGHYLLTGPGDGAPNVLWDATSGMQLVTLVGSRGDVAGFSADGRTMITSMAPLPGHGRTDIGLWDVAKRQLIKRIDTNGARATISPDGSRLFSYTGDTSGPNGAAWDTASGAQLWTIEQPGGIEHATFSPDGRTILAAGRGDIARTWDAASGSLVQEFHGHTNTIWDAAFSADGRFVLTASADKSARLWDSKTGRQVRYFPGHASSSVSGVAISPDSTQVAIASFDGTVQLTPTDSEALIASVCHRLQRDLTSDERAIYGIAGDRRTCPAT